MISGKHKTIENSSLLDRLLVGIEVIYAVIRDFRITTTARKNETIRHYTLKASQKKNGGKP
ncbi:hypothetical protein [Endozoicomonas sp. 8E]|uniref:hypothetical protein n=1 Tax=Endozoicomonas sp. 8E TaxID=3035692 RepID=UPI002938DF6C|nr:hypothetical protein [Endozoicomonas sp. 8E]WOG28151.1 hypothetical protein P6910_00425 [Endozoicomonas sp. 8E]